MSYFHAHIILKTPCVLSCLQGACVNLNTLDQVSPLHGACMQGHTTCAKLLLENGANVSKDFIF